MGFFGSSEKQTEYGVLIDIGSGSVLAAIVVSNTSQSHPEVIWSKREYAPLKNISSLQESAKHVMSSLLSVLMQLDSTGRETFREKTGKNKLPTTQITIAAPWSYTVSKSISYKHDESFLVTKDLIEELQRTADKKVEEEMKSNEEVNNLGLTIIHKSMIGLQANGYNTSLTTNQKAKNVQIVEVSAIAQKYLVDAIEDVRDKVLPGTSLEIFSFILVFFFVMKENHPEICDYCLVDVTFEATEVGIVRNGVLTYTTHAPFGAFSIAREIAGIINVPIEEAYGYLHNNDPISALSAVDSKKLEEIKLIFSKYQDRLTELFHETGDTLSIPKKVYVHGNLHTEDFFMQQIGSAAKKATGGSHALYPATKDVLSAKYETEAKDKINKSNDDTALLISAQFFHIAKMKGRYPHN